MFAAVGKKDGEYLHFRNGCQGGGHGHNDKLHIDVVCQGEDVLVDSGRYSYNFEQENRIWLKSAHAHNTILVDKKGLSGIS
ncbi:heparinase II/III domain-containing protein [Blautia argi]|uniref:heparinase II/III domain-containing protein n=1 Tax=Blautia argi TaxID=1912897 RepID=UPI00241C1A66